MKWVSNYLETIYYVNKNGVIKQKGVEVEAMPKNVHYLGIRLGRCKFSRFETVAKAVVAESKATAAKSAATRANKAPSKEEAEKNLKAAEKNLALVEESVARIGEVAPLESDGASAEEKAILLNAEEAANKALEAARKAVETAKASVASFIEVETDEVLPVEEIPTEQTDDVIPTDETPDEVPHTEVTDELAKKATDSGLTEVDLSKLPKFFKNETGEFFVWLPENQVFISLSPVTSENGDAFLGEKPLDKRTPKNYSVLLEKISSAVPTKEQYEELLALLMKATGTVTIEGFYHVCGFISFDHQLCTADGKYKSFRGEYKNLLENHPVFNLKCRKVLG